MVLKDMAYWIYLLTCMDIREWFCRFAGAIHFIFVITLDYSSNMILLLIPLTPCINDGLRELQ